MTTAIIENPSIIGLISMIGLNKKFAINRPPIPFLHHNPTELGKGRNLDLYAEIYTALNYSKKPRVISKSHELSARILRTIDKHQYK
ncbi:MAG: hypothetical protein E4G98_05150 [Promethearchaeota archaeon]|nr:MAG: hypothetical protein E4G98_05150 [Candidatus Lokiarchaeota archaeon]